eukprot:1191317-Prorocentrum_minimum.AAC.8
MQPDIMASIVANAAMLTRLLCDGRQLSARAVKKTRFVFGPPAQTRIRCVSALAPMLLETLLE